MEEGSGWDWMDWTKVTCGWARIENEMDRGTNLGTTGESGSRPVEDRILEHEEHCQEQEGALPERSTLIHPRGSSSGCTRRQAEAKAGTWWQEGKL